MKLSIVQRKAGKKSSAKVLRREGKIPAILYGPRQESGHPIAVERAEIDALLRATPSQLLSTTVLELLEGEKSMRVIVKEVQYHPVTYAILHIDFFLVEDDLPLTVNVPIQLVGTAECAGVKLGGFIRQVIRFLKVKCRLKDLPREFILDIQALGLSEVKRLSDIALPKEVRPLAKMNEVAVVIAKKA